MIAILVVFLYIRLSHNQLLSLEHTWKDTGEVQRFLYKNVRSGDKVLTETGSTIALTLYNKLFPPKDVITFDWIDYSGLQDDPGYYQAINDRYFDFIELDYQYDGKDQLREDIVNLIDPYYSVVYANNDIDEVYQKNEY